MNTLKQFVFYFLGIFNMIACFLAWVGIVFSVHFYYHDKWTMFHWAMLAISLIGCAAGTMMLWVWGFSSEIEKKSKPESKESSTTSEPL